MSLYGDGAEVFLSSTPCLESVGLAGHPYVVTVLRIYQLVRIHVMKLNAFTQFIDCVNYFPHGLTHPSINFVPKESSLPFEHS